jgi:hypothetical protein
MEVAEPFKIFVVVHKTTWCHTPEDHSHDNHHYGDLRSPMVIQKFVVEEYRMADAPL